MAAIKSYTDIEQSRMLAKILPLESADMYYDRGGLPSLIDKYVTHESIKNDKYHHLIPCWSLGALLELMPQRIYMSGAAHQFQLDKNWDNKTWQCAYDAHNSYIEKTGNTPLEAVYNMLIWLIENKFIDV